MPMQQMFLGVARPSGGSGVSNIIPYGLDQSATNNTDFMSRSYTASNDGRKRWTFATWFKKDTSSTLWLVGGLGTSNNHFNFRINSGGDFEAYQYEFTTQYGTFNVKSLATDAMDGNWHHVIMNYDSGYPTNGQQSRIRFYLDGHELAKTKESTYPAENQYSTFADGGTSYIGRNGYTDAYATDMKWADTYLAHNQTYGPTKFLTDDGKPVPFDTVINGEDSSTWADGFAFKYENNSNFGTNSLSSSNNWTSNGYSSGDQLTNITMPTRTPNSFVEIYSNAVTSNINFDTSSYDYSPSTGKMFDGNIYDPSTVRTVLTNDGHIDFVPSTPISFSKSVHMYVYAANGYSITNSYIADLNGNGFGQAGSNFVGSSTSGFNDFAWIEVATGSGTLHGLRLRLQRSGSQSSPNIRAIAIDGKLLLDNGGRSGLPDGYSATYGNVAGGYGGIAGEPQSAIRAIETNSFGYITASTTHIDFDMGTTITASGKTIRAVFTQYVNDSSSADYALQTSNTSDFSTILQTSSTEVSEDTGDYRTINLATTSDFRYIRLQYTGGGRVARLHQLNILG